MEHVQKCSQGFDCFMQFSVFNWTSHELLTIGLSLLAIGAWLLLVLYVWSSVGCQRHPWSCAQPWPHRIQVFPSCRPWNLSWVESQICHSHYSRDLGSFWGAPLWSSAATIWPNCTELLKFPTYCWPLYCRYFNICWGDWYGIHAHQMWPLHKIACRKTTFGMILVIIHVELQKSFGQTLLGPSWTLMLRWWFQSMMWRTTPS